MLSVRPSGLPLLQILEAGRKTIKNLPCPNTIIIDTYRKCFYPLTPIETTLYNIVNALSWHFTQLKREGTIFRLERSYAREEFQSTNCCGRIYIINVGQQGWLFLNIKYYTIYLTRIESTLSNIYRSKIGCVGCGGGQYSSVPVAESLRGA